MSKIPLGFIFFFLIANIYFALSNIPLLISSSRTPPKSVFPLYHSPYPYDYNVYLSTITLGQNGYWLNRDAFTSEKTKPGIFYFYYILVGKVSGLFHLWPPIAYHLARIISAELFFLGIYMVTQVLLGKKLAFWTSLLAVAGTIAPASFFGEKNAFTVYTPWWYSLEALKRADGFPHHLFGQALLLFSIFFILLLIKYKKRKYLLPASLLIIATGIILPPAILAITFCLPLAYILSILFKLFRKIPFRFEKSEIVFLILIIISTIIPILINIVQTRQGYPWIAWISWEISTWNFKEPNFNRALLFSFGILPILSFPAVIKIFKKEKWEEIFIILWAFMPFLLLPFATLLSLGKIRLISAAPFVPFAILAAKSIFQVFDFHKRKIFSIILLIIFSSSTIPLSIRSLLHDIAISNTAPLYPNIYISKSDWESINFIRMNVSKDSVILSNETTGNIIPAYSPVISYFGHINQTMDFEKKQDNVRLFFTQEMTPEGAKKFLSENQIDYVYFGPEEKKLGRDKLTYPFLHPVFEAENIILFSSAI